MGGAVAALDFTVPVHNCSSVHVNKITNTDECPTLRAMTIVNRLIKRNVTYTTQAAYNVVKL